MIAAVVLSAGGSTRMGQPKALLTIGDAKESCTFAERIARTAREGGVGSLVYVLGPPHGEAIRAQLPQGVDVVWNGAPERGMLSSIQVGIAALQQEVSAALIWPVDLPLVEVETIRRLLAAPEGWIAAPQYGSRGGHPVRIPRRFFAEVLSLPPAVGLRELFRVRETSVMRVEVPDRGAAFDVDTPDDYARLVQT